MSGKKFWSGKAKSLADYLGLFERTEQKHEYDGIPEGTGYSREAESLGNFLINSVPDGRGVFIFDPNSTTLPQWPFVKVAGLTSYKEDISLLYRSIDHAMNLKQENMLTLLSVPLAEDGSFDVQKTFSLAYHVQGNRVIPYSLQEGEKVKEGVASLKHTAFKAGESWNYDPERVPAVPSVGNR